MGIFGGVACHLRYALIIVLVVLVIILLSKWTGNSTTIYHPKLSKGVKNLVKEAGEWGNAAEHDTNALLQLMHATYAIAYLNAARTLASDKEIERLSRVQLDEMTQTLREKQQHVVQKLAGQYPALMPRGTWR